MRLLDRDLRLVAPPAVGVRLLERARCDCERLLDLWRAVEAALALARVRLEDLPRPFGAGDGRRCCCCWLLKDRLRPGEGWLLRARLEERPRFDSLGVDGAPEGVGAVCDRLVDRERLRWFLSVITST